MRLGIAIDRDADVPIGVQLGWVIRARIGDGTLRPGQRLPGLRDLAEAAGVNINTVRAVYQRLEHEGLVQEPPRERHIHHFSKGRVGYGWHDCRVGGARGT